MARISIVPEDYDGLKMEYLSTKKKLDDVNQELHDCRRQLKVMEALQADYQSEINMFQNEEIRQKQKYQETIVHLEDAMNKMRSAHSEQILSLETELMKMEEKYESLEAEVDILRKPNSDISFGGDTSKLIEEILSLKEENNGFTENHDQLLVNFKELQENNIELQRALIESQEETSNLKENLDYKKEELTEASSLIQKLNDEVLCLKSELESFKSKPLDEMSKGNSLFAEVDDRRVYLQDTINKMKADYMAMKQERAMNLNTIHKLKLEIPRLMERLKLNQSEKEDDEYCIVKSLQDRIKTLEDIVARNKKELEAKPLIISKINYEQMQYFETVLKAKNEEIKELKDKVSDQTITRILLSQSLKAANEEKRRWHLEATTKQHQLELKEIQDKMEGADKDIENVSDNKKSIQEGTEKGVEKPNVNSDKDATRISGNDVSRKNNQEKKMSILSEHNVGEKDLTVTSFEENQDNPIVDNTKTDEIEVIEDANHMSGILLGKENCPGTSAQPSGIITQRKKATFSADTVSPKKTATGRRIIVSKPVYMFSNPK